MAGYNVTAVLAFVLVELRGRETSSFCDLLKSDLLRFHPILLLPLCPLCLNQTSVFEICAHAIMINCYALDFSESRSEEVISFF